MITLQYLEYSPRLASLDERVVVDRLRGAFERLPFSHLIIGWYLPPRLLECCRLEADHLGISLIRWQPLLSGDGVFNPPPDWQVLNSTHRTINAYKNLPEFTFACPNHPQVRENISQRMETLISEGIYQGLFLDRVRYPSPSADPFRDLGCFCPYCHHAATAQGLDLESVRRSLDLAYGDENSRISLVQFLLGGEKHGTDPQLPAWLASFIRFRQKCVSDLVRSLSKMLHAAHLQVGLDCFSPSLATMVGQDLAELSKSASWIKLMTYAHSLGPAGIPFELIRFHDYLSKTTPLKSSEVLKVMSQALGLPLPSSSKVLAQSGLSSAALQLEIERGLRLCSVPVLAGIELVELEGVTHIQPAQLAADLQAVNRAGPAGLSLSWDLLYIPFDRLSLVKQRFTL